MKQIVEVPCEDYLKAVERWFDFWPTERTTPDFNEFLEIDHPPIKRNNDGVVTVFLPTKGARRVKLLAGPYHKALLRAYAMRKHD